MVYHTRGKIYKKLYNTNQTCNEIGYAQVKSLRPIKIRKHSSYGYSCVPTRLGKNKRSIKSSDHVISSPITLESSRIFPDGHLLIMDIKENHISTISAYEKNNTDCISKLSQMENESKIEWLSRISKYHPFLKIKIPGDNSEFYPSFHLKAIRVFKEHRDDTIGCVQLFNMDSPLSITFYHPSQITIRVIQ